jgi:hypothetical protein
MASAILKTVFPLIFWKYAPITKVLKRKVESVYCTSDLRINIRKIAIKLYAVMATVKAASVA